MLTNVNRQVFNGEGWNIQLKQQFGNNTFIPVPLTINGHTAEYKNAKRIWEKTKPNGLIQNLNFVHFYISCCKSNTASSCICIDWSITKSSYFPFISSPIAYLLTLPLFAGVSRVRALSPAWTGSHAWETLISHTHLFLPHDLPRTKESSTIKSWPTFCDKYFWKFPIWNSRADEKRREIRMVKVFKWYPVIGLFDTFTGKLGHGD